MGRLGDAGPGALALVPVQHLGDQQKLGVLSLAVVLPQGQSLRLLGTVKLRQILRQILAGYESIAAFGIRQQNFAQFHVQRQEHIAGNAALIFGNAAHNELAGIGGLCEGSHGDAVTGGNDPGRLGRAARTAGAGNGQSQAKNDQYNCMQTSTH